MNDYFISFGTTQGNLGVVCTTAASEPSALLKTIQLGINPGGEAAIWRMYKEEADKLGRDRLISPEEMKTLNYKSSKDLNKMEKQRFLDRAIVVCKDCNIQPRV